MNVFTELARQIVDRPGAVKQGEVGVTVRQQQRPGTHPDRRRKLRECPELCNPWNLTPPQCAVMKIMVHGHGNKTIAARLGISVKTVEVHLSLIYARIAASMQDRGDMPINRVTAAILWDRHFGNPLESE